MAIGNAVWKQMMVKQGYVPERCGLDGMIIWGLINRSEDPCAGCNELRAKCGGRPADKSYGKEKLSDL